MSTVTEGIAKILINNDGHYAGDPRASRVVTYENAWGTVSWAILYPHQDQQRYHNSDSCKNVRVVWEAKL